MNQKKEISASILSANFAKLGEEVKSVIQAGASRIHIDVMDNHYVPNLTVGPLVCQALRAEGIMVPLDVHLMVEPVDALVPMFAKAGATRIVFHPEASRHSDRTLQLIQDVGCEAGLAFNPATSLDYLDYVLDKVSVILIMSVNPGFGGQKFISSSLKKIKRAHELILESRYPIHLEVDGGIKADNIESISKAGANIFCMGSAIFESKNYSASIQEFKKLIVARCP